ncbi:Tn3 family transposase [Actinomadura soli]|nr:Tn3 family transposase [Actinomadura soli]
MPAQPRYKGDYPRLAPALARPIRWDLIAAQYDQMVKIMIIGVRDPALM